MPPDHSDQERPADPRIVEDGVDELKARTGEGVRWLMFGRIGVQIVSLGYAMALARLVTPAEFGVYGLAFVVLQFALYVDNMKVDSALVQARDASETALSSAAAFGALFAVAVATTIFLLAPTIAALLQSSEIAKVMRVMSAAFVLRSFFLVNRTLMRRRLMFRSQAVVDLAKVALGGGFAVWAAANGWGVWALVAYFLGRTLVDCVGTIVVAPWRPSAAPTLPALTDLLRFGLPSSGSELLVYAQYNLADLAVGRWHGLAPLGFYQQAQALLNKPVAWFDDVVNRLAFPVMSRHWHLTGDIRRGYTRAFGIVTAAAAPAAMAAGLLAPELIAVLYGPAWAASIPLLQILAPLGLLKVWQPLTSSAFQAVGRPSAELQVNVAVVVILGVLLWLSRGHGARGAAFALVAAFTTHAVLSHFALRRFIGLRVQDVLGRLAAPTIGCAVMASVAWAIRLFALEQRPLVMLLFSGCAIVAAYFGVLRLVDKKLMADAFSWLTRRSLSSKPSIPRTPGE